MLNELASLGPIPTLIVQATVLLLLGLLGSLVLRARPARAHALLTLGVLACLTLPIISGVVRAKEWGLLGAQAQPRFSVAVDADGFSTGNGSEIPPVLPRTAAASDSSAPSPHAASTAPASSPRKINWTQVALIAWLLASAALLVRLAWSFIAARRLLRHAEPLRNDRLEQVLAESSRRLSLRRPASAWKLPGSRCPAIWCWRREPMLVLPAEGTPDDAGVIRHELAHAARLDHVWAMAADLLVCLVPWHPVAWVVRRRMALLSERACDEWALEGTRESFAVRYADALLAYAPRSVPRLALSVAGGRGSLPTRVRAILHAARCDPRAGRAWRTGAAAVAVALMVGAALAQPGAGPAQQPSAPKPVQAPKAETPAQPAASTDDLKARLKALDDQNWREAFRVGEELAALPGDQGFSLLSDSWKSLPAEVKQQMLKAWFFEMTNHQRLPLKLLGVLDLGVSDANTEVQRWAMGYLKNIALRDFATKFSDYAAWRDAGRNKPTEAVIVQSVHDWVGRLRSEDASVRDEAIGLAREAGQTMRSVPAAKNEALKSDVLEQAAAWFVPGTPKQLQEAASEIMVALTPPEAYMRKVVLPAAENKNDSGLRDRAVRLLGSSKGWAYEPLAKILRDQFEARGAPDAGQLHLSSAAAALAQIGDPRAIPLMIAIIDADNTYDTVYGVGYFGLGKLTGVRYDEKHDGAWWRNWWDTNKARFPADVQAMPIEHLTAPAKRQAAAEPGEPDALADVADVPSQRITLGGDKHKQYFLIGPKTASNEPAGGRHLLVVLPGGAGGEDFNPFVRRILKNAAPDYVLAQPIAPAWRDDENRIVWPTAKLPDDKMAFSTEQFVRDVIEDARSRQKIDPKHVYLLGWSSGGPPVYSCLATQEMPITGAFVAMSVFKPETMPPLEGARGRALYLFHSPEDFIKMTFPNAAMQELGAAGVKVKLQTYEGGHGWHGDVFGNIRRGIEWLESQ